MSYFHYHATAKRLIAQGKLKAWFFAEAYHGIAPALILLFDDPIHPCMPIRAHRFAEYAPLLPKEKRRNNTVSPQEPD